MATYQFNNTFIPNYVEEMKASNHKLRKTVSGNAKTVTRWIEGGDMRTKNLIDFANKLDVDILNFFYKDGELMLDLDRKKDEEIERLRDEVQTIQAELNSIKNNASHAEVLSNSQKEHHATTVNILKDLMREQQENAERKEEQIRQRHMQELADKDKLVLTIQMEKNEELLRAKEEILHLKEEIAQLTAQYKELELASGSYKGSIAVAEKTTKKYTNT